MLIHIHIYVLIKYMYIHICICTYIFIFDVQSALQFWNLCDLVTLGTISYKSIQN